MGYLLFLATSLVCFAQAPGESYVVLDPTNPSAIDWVNVTLTGDDGELWLGVEEFNPATPTEHGLRAVRVDTSTETTEENVVLQAYGDLVSSGMYPSILTWSGTGNVLIVTKENVNQTNAHLRVITQTRANLAATPSFEAVTPTTTDYHHNKPVIARDGVLPEQFLCWTRENDSASDDQDVWSKPKDASTWLSSTDRSVSTTTDEEDHCGMDFHYDGTRYLVYHRNRTLCDDNEDTGCDDGVDNDGDGLIDETEDEIWLKITTWDGTTWTNVAHFELSGSPDNDFPTIWAQTVSTGISGQSLILVAAQGNANVNVWQCTGTVASCDQASDFTKTASAVPGGKDPKIFAVSRSFEHDQFIVYEEEVGGNEPRVKIAQKCDSASNWTTAGTLPLPSGSLSGTDMHLGRSVSSSNPQVHTEGSDFWISFFAQDPDNRVFVNGQWQTVDPATFFDVMVYHGVSGDFGCQ
jgi:hypothetical protein